VWQKVIDPDIDGDGLGNGVVGPPYLLSDFQKLAQMGANYVNFSVPGIFTEKPPYVVMPKVVQNLDNMVQLAKQAGLFVVISYRTGPGRNEYGFDASNTTTANHEVWKNAEAQKAWEAMWQYTANRYKNQSHVVGYDLMVEPNANQIFLKMWNPIEFAEKYGGSLYDWNPMAKRISMAIRAVDGQTPIIIGGMDYSSPYWLKGIIPTGDSRTIYAAHNYQPFTYTHAAPRSKFTYPGYFDGDEDGNKENINFAWIQSSLNDIDVFRARAKSPVTVNEYGVMRWERNADKYLNDVLNVYESKGINHAIWIWDPPSFPLDFDEFNFRKGPDPKKHVDVSDSALMQVLRKNWSKNVSRP
jgi:aryl-phospho-beta-D-glucosidase BglC (GH1 family)